MVFFFPGERRLRQHGVPVDKTPQLEVLVRSPDSSRRTVSGQPCVVSGFHS